MLDLRQVTFIDSSGLGVIVGQQKRSQEEGSSFSIAVAGASAVQRILDLSGLIKILDVVADPADASSARRVAVPPVATVARRCSPGERSAAIC